MTKRGYLDGGTEAFRLWRLREVALGLIGGELLLSHGGTHPASARAATAAGQGPSEPVRRSGGEWARPRAARARPDARGRDSPYAWRSHSPDTLHPACASAYPEPSWPGSRQPQWSSSGCLPSRLTAAV